MLSFEQQRAYRAILGHLTVNSNIRPGDDDTAKIHQQKDYEIVSKWLDLCDTFDRLMMNLRFTPVLVDDEEPLKIKKMPHSANQTHELFRLGTTQDDSEGMSFAHRNHMMAVLAYLVCGHMKRWRGTSSQFSYLTKSIVAALVSTIKDSPEAADHLLVLNQYLANDPVLQPSHYWQVKNSDVKPNAITWLLNGFSNLERERPKDYFKVRPIGPLDLARGNEHRDENDEKAYTVSSHEQDLDDSSIVHLQFKTDETTRVINYQDLITRSTQPSFDEVLQQIDTRFFTMAFMRYKAIVEDGGRYEKEYQRLDFEARDEFERITRNINILFTALINEPEYQARVVKAYIEHYGDVRLAYANIIPQLLYQAARDPIHGGISDLYAVDGTLKEMTAELKSYVESMTMSFNAPSTQNEVMSIITSEMKQLKGASLDEFYHFDKSKIIDECPYQTQYSVIGAVSNTFNSLAHVFSRSRFDGHILKPAKRQNDACEFTLKIIETDVFSEKLPDPEPIDTAGAGMVFA